MTFMYYSPFAIELQGDIQPEQDKSKERASWTNYKNAEFASLKKWRYYKFIYNI